MWTKSTFKKVVFHGRCFNGASSPVFCGWLYRPQGILSLLANEPREWTVPGAHTIMDDEIEVETGGELVMNRCGCIT